MSGNSSYWRTKSRPIIDKVLAETKGADEKVIRKALRDAYPFGLRRYHPYKIWCDEVRAQRGLKVDAEKIRFSKLGQQLLDEGNSVYSEATPAAPETDDSNGLDAARKA